MDELDDHISQLHEYNDIKDAGQMLLGKLGETRDSRGVSGLGRSPHPPPRVVAFCSWAFSRANPPTLHSCPTLLVPLPSGHLAKQLYSSLGIFLSTVESALELQAGLSMGSPTCCTED